MATEYYYVNNPTDTDKTSSMLGTNSPFIKLDASTELWYLKFDNDYIPDGGSLEYHVEKWPLWDQDREVSSKRADRALLEEVTKRCKKVVTDFWEANEGETPIKFAQVYGYIAVGLELLEKGFVSAARSYLDYLPVKTPFTASVKSALLTDIDAVLTDYPHLSDDEKYFEVLQNDKTFEGFVSNSVDDDNITINAGRVTDDTGLVLLELSAAATVDLSAGAVDGGLDTGTRTADSWYYVWIMYNIATAAIEVRASLSNTSPTMPSGFTHKALIGCVFNDSGDKVTPFQTYGSDRVKEYIFNVAPSVQSNVSIGTTKTDVDCSKAVPDLPASNALINLVFDCDSGANDLQFYHEDLGGAFMAVNSAAVAGSIPYLRLSSSRQFGVSSSSGTVTGVSMRIPQFKLIL